MFGSRYGAHFILRPSLLSPFDLILSFKRLLAAASSALPRNLRTYPPAALTFRSQRQASIVSPPKSTKMCKSCATRSRRTRSAAMVAQEAGMIRASIASTKMGTEKTRVTMMATTATRTMNLASRSQVEPAIYLLIDLSLF